MTKLEHEWESFVLRIKGKARTALQMGRHGTHAKIVAHVILDHGGKPILWVVPDGKSHDDVSGPKASWSELVEFTREEAKDTLGNSRDGLCIVTLTFIADKDGSLYSYRIGRGMRIEPSNNAKYVLKLLGLT